VVGKARLAAEEIATPVPMCTPSASIVHSSGDNTVLRAEHADCAGSGCGRGCRCFSLCSSEAQKKHVQAMRRQADRRPVMLAMPA
jgi:hypothetical protein